MKTNAKITVLGLMGNSVFLQVPHFHSAGETVHATDLYMEPGGKGCNQAVAAARMGAQVSFLSCMGADSIADGCIAFMQREGIVCYTETRQDIPSPYACILTDSAGENQVTVHVGSAAYMSADFVEGCSEIIARSDILLLNNECPQAANEAALRIASAHGVAAVLNPAPYLPLTPAYLSEFSIVTPNRHEAAMLTHLPADSSPEALLQGLRKLGIRKPVITLGNEGVIYWDGKKELRCPAIQTAARNTTGAGDCFSGVLSCCIAKGMPMAQSVKTACTAAAFSVSRMYVMPSLPHAHELKLN